MPSKHRDYKREYQLQKREGLSGSGSDSGNAKRHRARREYQKTHADLPSTVDLDHKKPLAKGGSNSPSNTRPRSVHSNRSAGGKQGNAHQKGVRKP